MRLRLAWRMTLGPWDGARPRVPYPSNIHALPGPFELELRRRQGPPPPPPKPMPAELSVEYRQQFAAFEEHQARISAVLAPHSESQKVARQAASRVLASLAPPVPTSARQPRSISPSSEVVSPRVARARAIALARRGKQAPRVPREQTEPVQPTEPMESTEARDASPVPEPMHCQSAGSTAPAEEQQSSDGCSAATAAASTSRPATPRELFQPGQGGPLLSTADRPTTPRAARLEDNDEAQPPTTTTLGLTHTGEDIVLAVLQLVRSAKRKPSKAGSSAASSATAAAPRRLSLISQALARSDQQTVDAELRAAQAIEYIKSAHQRDRDLRRQPGYKSALIGRLYTQPSASAAARIAKGEPARRQAPTPRHAPRTPRYAPPPAPPPPPPPPQSQRQEVAEDERQQGSTTFMTQPSLLASPPPQLREPPPPPQPPPTHGGHQLGSSACATARPVRARPNSAVVRSRADASDDPFAITSVRSQRARPYSARAGLSSPRGAQTTMARVAQHVSGDATAAARPRFSRPPSAPSTSRDASSRPAHAPSSGVGRHGASAAPSAAPSAPPPDIAEAAAAAAAPAVSGATSCAMPPSDVWSGDELERQLMALGACGGCAGAAAESEGPAVGTSGGEGGEYDGAESKEDESDDDEDCGGVGGVDGGYARLDADGTSRAREIATRSPERRGGVSLGRAAHVRGVGTIWDGAQATLAQGARALATAPPSSAFAGGSYCVADEKKGSFFCGGVGGGVGAAAPNQPGKLQGLFRPKRSWRRDAAASPPGSPHSSRSGGSSGHASPQNNGPSRHDRVDGYKRGVLEEVAAEEGEEKEEKKEEEEEEEAQMALGYETRRVAEDARRQEREREFNEHARAIGALRSTIAFAHLSEKQLHGLVRNCAKRRVLPRYAICYRAGADSAHVFILLDGSLQKMSASGEVLEAEGVSVDSLSLRGACFGMEALVTSGGVAPRGFNRAVTLRRTRTVHAASDCTLLQIAISDLQAEVPADLLAIVHQRHYATYVQGELQHMPIFDFIPPDTFDYIAPLWELEDHGAAGSHIFAEGDRGDKLYVLLQGRVSVHRGETVLSTLDADYSETRGGGGGSGGVAGAQGGHPFFGEMALLDGKRRMAAVVSKTPCTLLVLPVGSFGQFMRLVPDFKRRLLTYKALRARESELKVAIAAERHQRADDDDPERVQRLIRAVSAFDGPEAER